MKLKPLNYVDDCARDLQDFAELYREFPQTTRDFNAVLSLLRKATRFIVPNADDLLESDIFPQLEDFDHLHLPYPILAIEYDVDCQSSLIDPSLVDFNASKRIALAVEVGEIDLSDFSNHDFTKIPGFLVFSFWFTQQPGLWSTSLSPSFIPRHQLEIVNSSANAKEVPVYHLPTDQYVQRQATDIGILNVPLYPEINESVIQQFGKDQVSQSIHNDNQDEIKVILKFMTACQCRNIVVEKLPKPKVIATKKHRSLAKVDYHILKIDSKVTRQYHSQELSDEAKRKSPRQHLRRGHQRVYKSGHRIWIKPQVVGDKSLGNINKDYLWV